MKKIYLIALVCLLPLYATPVFACGGEDEEACDAAVDNQTQEADDAAQVAVDNINRINDHRSSGAICSGDNIRTDPRCQRIVDDVRERLSKGKPRVEPEKSEYDSAQ